MTNRAGEEPQVADVEPRDTAGRVVYKYPLRLTAQAQVVSMPVGARIVHVHPQTLGGDHAVCLWAEVDPSAPTVERTFCVFATGEPIAIAFRTYIGTVHIDWTVWHIYESERT